MLRRARQFVSELDTAAWIRHDSSVIGRLLLYGALVLAFGVVVVSACGPERVVLPRNSPSPSGQVTAAPTTAAPTSTVRTASPTAAPTTAAPTTSAPTQTGAASPGSTPASACPERTGGATNAQEQLTASASPTPCFDRVCRFCPLRALRYGMPDYRVSWHDFVGRAAAGRRRTPVSRAFLNASP